jgi:alkylated DNA repair dioxygenase AlkB
MKTLPDDFEFYPNFFSAEKADEYYHLLMSEIAWEHKKIRMFGKWIEEPRLSAWYGEEGAAYRYSGVLNIPRPFTKTLLEIRQKLQKFTQQSFNAVLMNLYRNGQDSMGYHADDEPELGMEPFIASISLGATRKFKIKTLTNEPTTHDLLLSHGSLLIMKGESQGLTRHALPKMQGISEPRINLTFRRIIPLDA